MDDVIYEEFKGTGNMEIHLDRRNAERQVFPAMNISRSGTRRDDKFVDPEGLKKRWILKKLLNNMEDGATEFLLQRMQQTTKNEDLFDAMKGGK